MAYKNQNYMTNRLIKETVDKNQVGYEEPKEEEVPTSADVSVVAKNNLNEFIEGCAVTLTKGEDIYNGITDDKGECTIKDVPFGTYQVLASTGNYTDVEQQFTVEESNNNLMITFTQQSFGIDGPTFEETEEESFF